MNMRLIIAGKDPLAVDTIHSFVIGFNPDRANAMNAKHSSFKPPQLKIEAATVQNNKLNLNLVVKPHQTVKAEVAVDGKILDKIVVDNFENVILGIDSTSTRPKNITVYAYDHFLNCTEKTVTIS